MKTKMASTASSLAGVVLFLSACAINAPPQESFDGLVLVPDTRFAEVYRRPGVDLSTYETFGLQACEVAFKKNWLREQNMSSINLNNRMTQRDVDRIKDALGTQCNETFRSALEKAPSYTLVDQFSEGEQVLVLRPKIINLDINAPDIPTAGRQSNYTDDAGQMTLLLEALDATTGETLVRVIDRRRDIDSNRLQWTNSVTNRAAAQRILNNWARQFREGLDEMVRPVPKDPR